MDQTSLFARPRPTFRKVPALGSQQPVYHYQGTKHDALCSTCRSCAQVGLLLPSSTLARVKVSCRYGAVTAKSSAAGRQIDVSGLAPSRGKASPDSPLKHSISYSIVSKVALAASDAD